MKLALISHGPAGDPRQFSGIPWHILQELRRQGHEVEPFDAKPAAWTLPWAQFKNRLSLKFSRQPHHPEADPWVLRTRALRLDRIVRAFRPDAVLCAGFPEAAAAISAKLPLYVWMDALYPTVRRSYPYFRDYYSESDARILGQIEDGVLRRARKVWLSSAWAANEAKADFPQAAVHIGVQSFGANLPKPPTVDEVEKSLGARNLAQPTLLFLVNEWERKGGETAVETMRRLRELGCPAKLAVVGLNKRPPSVSAEPGLEWMGRLDKSVPAEAQQLEKLLSESAFLLLPTKADCTPIACHEAAAYGLPVLATDVGGLSSTVDAGKSGMLWPVEKFAAEAPAWITALLADRTRYETMARAARHRFEAIGNWAVNVRAVAGAMAADLKK
ncbi:MAG TPA: glycosyltransferase family 4 protein [Opitutales bacterium]|nr:glycosyltransferase family 4 protein [Opitutales bacterium]